MSFNFPDNPAAGDEFESGGVKYTWSGTAWDLFTAGTTNDFVLKAGDTMTGALNFNSAGFSIHSDTHFKINAPAGAKHYWYVNGLEKARLEGDATPGNFVVQGHIYAQAGGRFIFNNTDNNAWQNALSFNGGIHLQYHQGGNNDGRLRVFTSNGGYSDAYVFETTIVSGAPGIVVNGNMSAGSITCRGGHIHCTNVDGYGIDFFSGAIIYKAVGAGLVIRKHTGNTQIAIENNDGTGRVSIATTWLRGTVEEQIGDAVAPLLKMIKELQTELTALKAKVR